MQTILLYLLFAFLIIFNELNAHDISMATCYSQSLTKQNSFRLSMVRGSWEIYRQEMSSINIIQDNSSENKYYISTNTITFLLTYLAINNRIGEYLGILFLPQVLGNTKFNIELYPQYAQLTIGQTTDYYLHYKVSRIFTASSIGLESHIEKLRLVATLEVPLSKGYRKDKSPYVQLSAGYYF